MLLEHERYLEPLYESLQCLSGAWGSHGTISGKLMEVWIALFVLVFIKVE